MFGETLPEIPAAETLTDVWRDLNYAREGFAGALPFEWRELQAFSDMSGRVLAPCEASCLMDMSRAYCTAIADKNPLSKPPMERDLWQT